MKANSWMLAANAGAALAFTGVGGSRPLVNPTASLDVLRSQQMLLTQISTCMARAIMMADIMSGKLPF